MDYNSKIRTIEILPLQTAIWANAFHSLQCRFATAQVAVLHPQMCVTHTSTACPQMSVLSGMFIVRTTSEKLWQILVHLGPISVVTVTETAAET